MRRYFFALVLYWLVAQLVASEAKPLISADFDEEKHSGLAQALLKHKSISLAKGAGINNSNAIKVAYVGYEQGSKRVVVRYPIGKALRAARLEFHVRFDQDFLFVKGGKLHGLGPKYPITGGKERKPNGWSTRCMFKQDGRIMTYIYDQSKDKRWGIGITSKKPVFKKDVWHHVVYHIQLNDANQANGSMRVVIDNTEVLKHTDLIIRGSDDKETLIQTFLLSTFHGGNKDTWAPKDKDGNYKTVYAYFDSFKVTASEE